MCVNDRLTEYFERTKAFRNPDHSNDPLLRTIIRPHKGLTSNTVSNWIKDMMILSGIDTTFKSHSARGASTSKPIEVVFLLMMLLKWLIGLMLEHFSNFFAG